MAVPCASAFRRTHPDGFVAWAVEDRCAAVVDTEALVDERVEARRQTWKAGRWSPRTWREQFAFYSGLRKLRFDYGVDLQGHSKTALCLRIARPAKRAAVGGTDVLARRLNPVVVEKDPLQHRVERNLDVLRSLSEFPGDSAPMMPKAEAARRWVKESRGSALPLATITVSAGHPAKVVPMQHWVAVAERLMAAGFQAAFLGGPGDPEPAVPEAVNWVGSLPLERTMAAVAESAIHLCGDTGTGHIAAAYGIPVISVFGNMEPARYRPYTEKGVVLKEGAKAADVPLEGILLAIDFMMERYGA